MVAAIFFHSNVKLKTAIKERNSQDSESMLSVVKSAHELNTTAEDMSDVTELYASLALGSAYNDGEYLTLAQKCCRYNPSNPKSIALLCLSLNARIIKRKSEAQNCEELLISLSNLIDGLLLTSIDHESNLWARFFRIDFDIKSIIFISESYSRYSGLKITDKLDSLIEETEDNNLLLCCHSLLININSSKVTEPMTELIDQTSNATEARIVCIPIVFL